MRIELRELQRRLRITTVYVTHDQSEALAMSNLIAVMQAGEIVQLGSPREIYRQPNGKFVADLQPGLSGSPAVKPLSPPAPIGSQSRIEISANFPRERTATAPLSCCAAVTQYGKR